MSLVNHQWERITRDILTLLGIPIKLIKSLEIPFPTIYYHGNGVHFDVYHKLKLSHIGKISPLPISSLKSLIIDHFQLPSQDILDSLCGNVIKKIKYVNIVYTPVAGDIKNTIPSTHNQLIQMSIGNLKTLKLQQTNVLDSNLVYIINQNPLLKNISLVNVKVHQHGMITTVGHINSLEFFEKITLNRIKRFEYKSISSSFTNSIDIKSLCDKFNIQYLNGQFNYYAANTNIPNDYPLNYSLETLTLWNDTIAFDEKIWKTLKSLKLLSIEANRRVQVPSILSGLVSLSQDLSKDTKITLALSIISDENLLNILDAIQLNENITNLSLIFECQPNVERGIGLEEMNKLEFWFLSLLDFKVHVSLSEYGKYYSQIEIVKRKIPVASLKKQTSTNQFSPQSQEHQLQNPIENVDQNDSGNQKSIKELIKQFEDKTIINI
eukprot:gene5547-6908_t